MNGLWKIDRETETTSTQQNSLLFTKSQYTLNKYNVKTKTDSIAMQYQLSIFTIVHSANRPDVYVS